VYMIYKWEYKYKVGHWCDYVNAVSEAMLQNVFTSFVILCYHEVRERERERERQRERERESACVRARARTRACMHICVPPM
jgi:hypothetical protein